MRGNEWSGAARAIGVIGAYTSLLEVRMPRTSERPAASASFDDMEFERDSEVHVKAARPQPESALLETPRSEARIAKRPRLDDETADDAWARGVTGEPVIAIADDLLRRLPLDHRAGFLLSLMDGTMDLETVLDVSAMPREDALRMVRSLFELGVVAFR